MLFILLVLSLFSCTKDCMEKPGNIITQEVTVPFFDKIIAGSGIQLSIEENPNQSIHITTGENRMDQVYYEVQDSTLFIEADNLCMLSSSYDPIRVFVKSPLISVIRNASENPITSQGVLTYPDITLWVEDDESNYLNVGDFNLQLDNQKVHVISNGIGNTHLTGQTEQLIVSYYNGIGKFEGKDLQAKQVFIFHRGENTISVNPTESLQGDIYSIGNLLSYSHPPIVHVTEHYEGRLIFL